MGENNGQKLILFFLQLAIVFSFLFSVLCVFFVFIMLFLHLGILSIIPLLVAVISFYWAKFLIKRRKLYKSYYKKNSFTKKDMEELQEQNKMLIRLYNIKVNYNFIFLIIFSGIVLFSVFFLQKNRGIMVGGVFVIIFLWGSFFLAKRTSDTIMRSNVDFTKKGKQQSALILVYAKKKFNFAIFLIIIFTLLYLFMVYSASNEEISVASKVGFGVILAIIWGFVFLLRGYVLNRLKMENEKR